mgnify:CR=1 FL=1
MKQKLKLWEYLISNASDINEINELGSNGWELVSVVYFPPVNVNNTSFLATINYYFKRQLIKFK